MCSAPLRTEAVQMRNDDIDALVRAVPKLLQSPEAPLPTVPPEEFDEPDDQGFTHRCRRTYTNYEFSLLQLGTEAQNVDALWAGVLLKGGHLDQGKLDPIALPRTSCVI